MKLLTAYGLAFLLFTGGTAALAGGKGHGGHHGGKNYNSGKHYSGGHSYRGYRNKHRVRHYNHYRPYRNNFYYGSYYRPNYFYPSYLGAALVGSALTSSLYHTHNGERCNDRHADSDYRQSSGNREVVGCHRIEVLADGSERRVEVPMSQCN